MAKKWIAVTLVLGTLFAALALLAARPLRAAQAADHTYYETFTTTAYLDAAHTTALWDTATGQLRLHPPVPGREGVAGQLYYPTAWNPAVYVSDSGRVYLFGGPGETRVIQEYDPATNASFKSALVLPYPLQGSAAVYAPSRHAVYLLGGSSRRDIVVVDVGQMVTTVLANRLPAPLSYASAVYVPHQDKAYIFGGLSARGSPLATVFEYDLSAGTVLTLSVSLPISVAMTSAIYDPVTDSAYVFGGEADGLALPQVIRFDVAQQSAATLPALPEAFSGAGVVHIPEQGKVYLFGGQRGETFLSQILAFDIASTTATTLTASLSFPRSGAAAVYVPSRGRAYVLGGQLFGFVYPEVAEFDVNAGTITDVSTGVAGRSGAAAVYVPGTQKAYLFGGRSYADPASQEILAYDVRRVTTQLLPATLPVSRTETAAVYNPVTNQAYIFGGAQPGQTTQYFADILRFDVATETLVRANAVLPTARAGMAAVYVPGKGKAYLFGGTGASGCLDQILTYDPAQDTVTQLSAKLPKALAYAAAVYDAATNKVFLFGGWNPDVFLKHLDEIVAFDVASETATVLPAKLPLLRAKAAAIAVAGGSKAYVIGGTYGPGLHLGDVVSFDMATGVITSVPGIWLGEGRSGGAAVYVPEKATAYLFGGTSGYLADRPLDNIAMLKFAYPLSETAQSLMVNQPGEEVHEALLSAQQSLQGGYLHYSLSNDGGRTWAAVPPGMKHTFAAPGSDLRWRAVLGGNGETTPLLDSLTITYNEIVLYQAFLPVILKQQRP